MLIPPARLWAFALAATLLALAPGPDNCFVLAQATANGAMAGLCVTAGLVTGLCVHITLAVLGVAVLLTRFPRLADGILIAGAFYLLWVAYHMWAGGLEAGQAAQTHSLLRFYGYGIVLNLSNPKVILFFLAFLPKFLPTPCAAPRRALLLLGFLFACCAFTVMGAIALLGGLLAGFLARNPASALWTGRIAALAVGLIALWILLPFLLPRHRTAKDA